MNLLFKQGGYGAPPLRTVSRRRAVTGALFSVAAADDARHVLVAQGWQGLLRDRLSEPDLGVPAVPEPPESRRILVTAAVGAALVTVLSRLQDQIPSLALVAVLVAMVLLIDQRSRRRSRAAALQQIRERAPQLSATERTLALEKFQATWGGELRSDFRHTRRYVEKLDEAGVRNLPQE